MQYAADLEMMRERYSKPKFGLVPLGSLTTLVQYGTSERSISEPIGVPVLRIPNLQAEGWDLTDLKYLQLSTAELATYRLEKGDILFNRTNGSRDLVGKCEVFNFDGDWAFASYLIRLRLDREQAIPEFVSAFLNTYWGRRQVEHVSRQILMSNINTEEIRALRVPLPEPPQQKELLRTLDAARERRKKMLADANALLAGLDDFVLEQLGLTLSPPSTHRTTYAVRWRDVAAGKKLYPDYYHPERINAIDAIEAVFGEDSSMSLGRLADFRRDQRLVETNDDYLGLANVQPNTGERCESTEDDGKGTVFEYAENDVLFARLRPYLNKVYRAEHGGVCSPEFHVMRIRDGESGGLLVLPDYLAAVLRSGVVLAQTRHMMTGNTHPRLANDDVVKLVVPIPDDAVQANIAAEVARRREKARELRAAAADVWEQAKTDFEASLLGPVQ